ncbi:hypothetical protein BE21_19915 [Sorangium cellulosum]|uniref:Uncharacterized protein n=1 Tax=Sorangium cellulosum TaxID=56 RepID=A0A150TWI9_SORCE|nr:hypothetical protein BE21_19915 [Sorangium cellulosum]
MQAISDALNRLHEDAAWFARAHELKLLRVRCAGDLRATALKLLLGLEFHADNFSPWVVLEDAHSAAEGGWQVRATRVLANWELRRDAFAKEGVEMPTATPALSLPDGALLASALHAGIPLRSSGGLGPFAAALHGVLGALRPPLRGLVVVLAPTVIESMAAFEAELTALVQAPTLADCRWVLVHDTTADGPAKLLQALGARALICNCVIDPAQQDRDLDTLLAGGDGPQAARAGMAGPRGVVPPKRVDGPPELPREARDAALRLAGIDPAYLDEAPRLRSLVLGAAVAIKRGKGPEAVRLQREARDLCERLSLHAMKVICQVALASYLSGLGERGRAIAELRDATAYAQRWGLGQQESQARLALGLLLALGGQHHEAASEYAIAGQCAERAGISPLAIEAWRLAGQLALQVKMEPHAIASFKEAIRIAGQSANDVVKLSSAAEAARKLASVCRARGLGAQAASLEEQAGQMERGEFGTAPASAAADAGAGA